MKMTQNFDVIKFEAMRRIEKYVASRYNEHVFLYAVNDCMGIMGGESHSMVQSEIKSILKERYRNNPIVIIKFCSQPAYACEAKEGLFWANPVSFFRESAVKGIADRYEAMPRIEKFDEKGCTLAWTVLPKGEVPTGKEIYTRIPGIRNMAYINPNDANTSIICFYALTLDDFEVEYRDRKILLYSRIDSRLIDEFGTHMVVFSGDIFNTAIEKFKKSYPYTLFDKVTYLDDDTSMIKTFEELSEHDEKARKRFLYKASTYSYQKEWRLVFPYAFNNSNVRHIPLDVCGYIIEGNPDKAIWLKCDINVDIDKDDGDKAKT
jgi:hypothetical protein